MLILLAFVCQVHAGVVTTSSSSGHEEMLMSGAGLARTGSTGAVNTNPALLGWVSKQEQFTNTSAIVFYKFKNEPGTPSAEIAPSVLPLYSATTARNGSWGYGWSLGTSTFKTQFSSVSNGFHTSGRAESNTASLAVAAGKKVNDWGLGARLAVGREVNEGITNYYGTSSGFDFLGSSDYRSELWKIESTIGMVSKLSENSQYAIALSGPIAVINSRKNEATTSYNEATGATTAEHDRTIPGTARQYVLKGGVAVRVRQMRLYHDAFVVSGHKETNDNGKGRHYVGGVAGLEMFHEKWTYYTGVSLTEASYESDQSGQKASYSVAGGMKRKHKHATTMYGAYLQREMASSTSQVVGLIFGTKFAY